MKETMLLLIKQVIARYQSEPLSIDSSMYIYAEKQYDEQIAIMLKWEEMAMAIISYINNFFWCWRSTKHSLRLT